jgi:hypothetical protein
MPQMGAKCAQEELVAAHFDDASGAFELVEQGRLPQADKG